MKLILSYANYSGTNKKRILSTKIQHIKLFSICLHPMKMQLRRFNTIMPKNSNLFNPLLSNPQMGGHRYFRFGRLFIIQIILTLTLLVAGSCKREKEKQNSPSPSTPQQRKKKNSKKTTKNITSMSEPLRLPPFSSPRMPCNKKYTAVLSSKDIRNTCIHPQPQPIVFSHPGGCIYRYPGTGAVLIMESPSYRKLKKKFPNVKGRLPSGSKHLKSFSFSTADRTINSLVLETPEKKGLLLQAPTAVCKKEELSALAEVVFRRLTSR